MSKNLLKMRFTNLLDDEKRLIDVNDRAERRLEELERQNAAALSHDGFEEGLFAEQVDGLLPDGEADEGVQSNVIKANANADQEAASADVNAAAEDLLKQTVARAQAEAEEILADARAQIEHEREAEFTQAREQGYQEGFQQAEREFDVKQRALAEREKALEAEYDHLLEGLEPRFVDAITGVYEHLFQVELSGYRDILLHLIASAVRKIEGSKDFLIHVSGEDYPYVSMEKKQLMAALASPNATLELVEDITLGHNECMIETDGGIFDCGLGTQLAELTQKLKLLSYEKV